MLRQFPEKGRDSITPGQDRKMTKCCPLSSGRGLTRGVGRETEETVRVSEGPGKEREACCQVPSPVERLPWNLLGTGGGERSWDRSPDLMMGTQSYSGGNSALREH